jgi:hypothetical protein
LRIYPSKILSRRAIKRDNIAVPQILLSWTNLPPEDASWEDYGDIASRFPKFILEDKKNFERGGVSDTGTDIVQADGEEGGSTYLIKGRAGGQL